jgi:Raf kinase inhibitor-like YbhB/YbcL family protein
MAFTLTSFAFHEGKTIPVEYTCEGTDTSPELKWRDAPPETHSFALIMHDPDAPDGDFTHWLMWDIPGNLFILTAGTGSAPVSTTGVNSFGRPGYGGPCPPLGDGPHRYFFELYALDIRHLQIASGAQREELETALQGHILAQAQLMGVYERKEE